jgi:hypothetical protein
MPSNASKAAALQRDRAKLTAVPDLPADPPKPDTRGDAARAAAVAALPEYQQAEYQRLRGDGTRHVTALGAARKFPDPAEQAAAAPQVEDMAAALFAAFQTGQVGAAGPAESLDVTVAAKNEQPEDEPAGPPPAPGPAPKPVPAPKPASPKPAPAPRPAAPADGSCERHIGTVTATGLDGQEHVYDCEHAARNGHMDISTAETCAKRLLRNHPGTPGTRVHPVRRDRTGRRLS